MIKSEDIYPIGKFQKTHALKGELNIILDILPDYFVEGNPLIVEYDGINVPYYVESIRKKGNTSFLIKLDGVETEQQAAVFVNKEVYIPKIDAEELLDDYDDNEYLIGYEVIDELNNQKLGTIEFIDDSTVNELFIIKNCNGEELIIPANEDLIQEIDEDNKQIKMKLPEGLVNLNKKE